MSKDATCGFGSSFALVVVLFILLIIIGCCSYGGGYGSRHGYC
ncbi:YjcZ family sporulation protein [Priestia aryabhattai]|nr:YjcZ family sporulation protein [Priestia aryabhattai]MCM3774117.1 YjcZ family sporulation protein [Priestia aryabhattai]